MRKSKIFRIKCAYFMPDRKTAARVKQSQSSSRFCFDEILLSALLFGGA